MTAQTRVGHRDWHWQMAHRIRGIEDLHRYGSIGVGHLSASARVSETYPIAITSYYLSLIQGSGLDHPIGKQCLPDPREIDNVRGEKDPLQEGRNMPVPGLVHRYPDRCLVLVTRVCAVNCRHCNRKHLWSKSPRTISRRMWQGILSYIGQNKNLREVIISGGDPLTLSDDLLDGLLGDLRKIHHVEVIRIGSRTPVVMPMRITRGLCGMLKRHRPLWLNTQFNHPLEITPQSAKACERLLESVIPVSSQTVLLRDVNDRFEVLKELFYGLQKISVRPYYLFHCDPVRGAWHFQTDIRDGLLIMENLWKSCSGLCLPRYILDRAEGKTALDRFL